MRDKWLQIRVRRYSLVAFNSLFEMQKIARWLGAEYIYVSFNSLFEMLYIRSRTAARILRMFFQFSI